MWVHANSQGVCLHGVDKGSGGHAQTQWTWVHTVKMDRLTLVYKPHFEYKLMPPVSAYTEKPSEPIHVQTTPPNHRDIKNGGWTLTRDDMVLPQAKVSRLNSSFVCVCVCACVHACVCVCVCVRAYVRASVVRGQI